MAEINITKAKTSWITPMVYGILLVVVGVCMILFKKDALKWILIVSGIMMIISALINIAVVMKVAGQFPVLSILSIVLGVLLIVLPNLMADVLMAILAVVLILYGALNVMGGALGYRQNGVLVSVFDIAVGILAIVAGVYALFNLDTTADIVMIVIGAFTIFIGAIQILVAVGLYRQFH